MAARLRQLSHPHAIEKFTQIYSMREFFFCVFWRLSTVLLTKYDLMFIDFLTKCPSFTFFHGCQV